jgi:glycosyltransferase involved in cell wall biosynthesis
MPRPPHTALIVAKGKPTPPLLSLAVALSTDGRRVLFAPSLCDDATVAYLESRGVTVQQLQPGISHPKHVFGKLQYWLQFRQRAWQLIAGHPETELLWIGSADTALALGRALQSRNYVLHLRELYDTVPYYQRHLREYARRAQVVVVPESTRAAIYRSWYGLERTPCVLPNKPLEHPRDRRLPIGDARARALLAGIPAGTRIVMYQGIIHADRDLRPVGKAVQALGAGWKFVVVGEDQGFLPDLLAACPQTLHVPFVPPPYHLEVASHADIGVLAYTFENLNNVFCAPNKVWEYAGFGMPMLGNDVPGLGLLPQFHAGLCVDFSNPPAIRTALEQLIQNRDGYATGSATLFDDFDLRDIVREISATATAAA